MRKRPVFEAEFCLEVKEHRISSIDVSDNHLEVGNRGGNLLNYETQYTKIAEVSLNSSDCIFVWLVFCIKKMKRSYLLVKKGGSVRKVIDEIKYLPRLIQIAYLSN